MSIINQEELEEILMETLLGGGGLILSSLRAQASLIERRERFFSGKGFATTFRLGHAAEPLPGNPNLTIRDVNGAERSLANGFGVILFVEDGLIESLEAFTYGEDWPKQLTDVELSLDDTSIRTISPY